VSKEVTLQNRYKFCGGRADKKGGKAVLGTIPTPEKEKNSTGTRGRSGSARRSYGQFKNY